MSIWVIASGLIVSVVGGLLGGLALMEAKGWLPHLQQRILRGAIGRLPESHRDRYAEEWAALLDEYSDRPLTACVQAVSLLMKAPAIGRELVPQPQAVNPRAGRPASSRGGRNQIITVATSLLGRLLQSGRHRLVSRSGRSGFTQVLLRGVREVVGSTAPVIGSLGAVVRYAIAVWGDLLRASWGVFRVFGEVVREEFATMFDLFDEAFGFERSVVRPVVIGAFFLALGIVVAEKLF
jgi:hypothetical protein